MAKTDIESVLGKVKAFLVANLNTQIAALNAEKNDGITLKTVDSTAYHLQYPQDRAEPNDPFIVYEEAGEPEIETNGANIATVHTVAITLVLADNGNDTQMVNRLFRYRRALKDLVVPNWTQIAGENKFTVRELLPTPPMKEMNTGFLARFVGIELSVAITD